MKEIKSDISELALRFIPKNQKVNWLINNKSKIKNNLTLFNQKRCWLLKDLERP